MTLATSRPLTATSRCILQNNDNAPRPSQQAERVITPELQSDLLICMHELQCAPRYIM